MEKSVFCIVPSEALALTIVNNLRLAGFCNTDVSVLFSDEMGTHDPTGHHGSLMEQGNGNGAEVHAVFGGALGWLAGIEILVLPDAGPHVAAGPIAPALREHAGLSGAIVGALTAMGLPEHQAARFAARVRDGNILLCVQSGDRGQRERAREILKVGGGSEVYPTNESRTELDAEHEREARVETR